MTFHLHVPEERLHSMEASVVVVNAQELLRSGKCVAVLRTQVAEVRPTNITSNGNALSPALIMIIRVSVQFPACLFDHITIHSSPTLHRCLIPYVPPVRLPYCHFLAMFLIQANLLLRVSASLILRTDRTPCDCWRASSPTQREAIITKSTRGGTIRRAEA